MLFTNTDNSPNATWGQQKHQLRNKHTILGMFLLWAYRGSAPVWAAGICWLYPLLWA